MDTKPKVSKKIKRKNFFYYLGASALGAYALTKQPFNIIKSAFIKPQAVKGIKIELNPMAVKRDNRETKHNG
jgi:hypothetical protein